MVGERGLRPGGWMAPVQREGPDPGRGAAIIVAVAAAGGLRRLAVAATGLTLAAGLGACNALPGGRDARPGGVSREGPAAAWTATVATGDHQIAVQGDVVVVSDERALLGLDLAS